MRHSDKPSSFPFKPVTFSALLGIAALTSFARPAAFGHDVSAFKEPAFQQFFFAGIRWAAHRI